MKPSQATELATLYVQAGQPVIMHGSPGIGKSSIVHQIAKNLNLPLIDMRLSQMDSVDLRGIPYRDNGMTYWATNSQLPTDEKVHGPEGILFLDEFTSARREMQAPAYQIVLDHRIGTTPLLPGWRIMAAGNLTSDRAIVEQMSTALKNRFGHIFLESDHEDWCAWALNSGVSVEVLGFIRFRPNLLNDFENAIAKDKKSVDKGQKMTDLMAFATPRSWGFVDKMLKKGVPSHLEYDLYSGLVGEGATAEFLAYVKHHRDLPNLDQLLMAPDKAVVPTEPAQLYALSTGLAAKITEDNIDRAVKYLDRIPKEFQVMCVKDAVVRSPVLCSTKTFNTWSVKNAKVLM